MKSSPFQKVIILFFTFLFAPLAQLARAQIVITITENSTKLDFPRKLTFVISASSNSNITELYLLRKSNARSCSGSFARQQVKDFTPGKEVKAEWTWDFFDSGGLPPGAEITWQWEVRTQGGEIWTSEENTVALEDERFTWKRLEQDSILVEWVEGSQAFGRQLLQFTKQSLERIAAQAGVDYQGKVRIVVYPTFKEMRSALLFEPEWVGGQTFVDFDIILTAIEPEQFTWMNEIIPHELAHVVTSGVTFNCVGAYMSTWLSEGLAQLAEGDLPKDVQSRILDDLKNSRLPALKALARGFPDNPQKANQAYEFSYVVVDFLVNTYGSEKMGNVLRAIQSGKLTDQALRQVYGLDTEGIDQTWRAANGVGEAPMPVEEGNASATPTRVPIPTLPLWTPVFETSTQPPTSEMATIISPSVTWASPTTLLPTMTASAMPSVTSVEQGNEEKSSWRCLGGLISLPVLFMVVLWFQGKVPFGFSAREKNDTKKLNGLGNRMGGDHG